MYKLLVTTITISSRLNQLETDVQVIEFSDKNQAKAAWIALDDKEHQSQFFTTYTTAVELY